MWAGRLSLRICDEAAERDEATAGRSHREVRDLLVGVREMEELQERLAEVEVERDEALARCRRRDAQLIELAESQRTMQEHAQIISAKYQRAKTEIEQILWRYLLENCADFHSLSEAGGCRAVRSETEACVDGIRLCTELAGEGHFGQVRLGVTPMGATVAVKVISKAKVRSLHALRSLAQEVAAIRALSLCLLYTSPSPRDGLLSRMPSSA